MRLLVSAGLAIMSAVSLALAAQAPDTTSVDAVLHLLKQDYYGPVDEPALRQAAAQGGLPALVAALPVQPVELFPADTTLRNALRTDFGLGLVTRGARTTILVVDPFSPAWRAGLRVGDVVQAIDDTDVRSASVTDVIRILSRHGTGLTLAVSRADQITTVTMQAEARQAVLHEQDGLPAGTAYLAPLDLEAPDMIDDLQTALSTIRQSGVQRLVIDLRDNQGGALYVVVRALTALLPDHVTASLTDRSGKAIPFVAGTVPNANAFRGQLIVLVNRGTSVGAELMATGLQAHGARLVGERSAGYRYASRSSLIPTTGQPNGGDVMITYPIAVMTVDGRAIPADGVQPDVIVRDDRPRLPAGTIIDPPHDAVLQTALDVFARG